MYLHGQSKLKSVQLQTDRNNLNIFMLFELFIIINNANVIRLKAHVKPFYVYSYKNCGFIFEFRTI